jgi:monofunctional biosynthetic peptidoglycan transglycosylase
MRRVGRAAAAIAAAAFAVLAYIYVTLPDVRVLQNSNPTTTAFMELRERDARAGGKAPRRQHRWVPYNRISEQLKRAVLVAEDDAFWQHDGIDLEQILKAREYNLQQGRVVRGASTITQQLAKNLYLSPSRNYVRKLRELLITRRLEAELSKRRILELYLNVIEWGDGIWGAEAAARAYFRRSAATITAPEAALMAGAIINPRVLNPRRPSARLAARQRLILRRMRYVEPPPIIEAAELAGTPEGSTVPVDSIELPGTALPPEPPPEPLPEVKPIPIPFPQPR